jgi:hypothetical protein
MSEAKSGLRVSPGFHPGYEQSSMRWNVIYADRVIYAVPQAGRHCCRLWKDTSPKQANVIYAKGVIYASDVMYGEIVTYAAGQRRHL